MSKSNATLIKALQNSLKTTSQLEELLAAELQRESSADVERKTTTVNVKKAQEDLVVDEDMFAAIVEKGRPEILKLAKKLELDFKRTAKTDELVALIGEHLGFELEEDEEEEEEEEDEIEEDEEEGDEEGVDLSEMDHKELVSFIEENFEDADIPKKKKSERVAEYADRLREFIESDLMAETEEDDVEDVEEEEEEEEVVAPVKKKSPAKKAEPKKELVITYEDEDGEEVDVNLLEMTPKEIRELASDFDITLPAKKNVEQLAQMLFDAFQEDVEEEEEEEEEEVVEAPKKSAKASKAAPKKTTKELEEEYGLDELELDDLAEILAENGLSTSGKRAALVARIVEGVEDGTIEAE